MTCVRDGFIVGLLVLALLVLSGCACKSYYVNKKEIGVRYESCRIESKEAQID